MNIRRANLEDIKNNLLELYVDGFNHHYNGRPDVFSNKTKLELKDELIDVINNSNILVLEDNNKILGFVVYKIKEKHNKILWISQLVIDKEHRHLGNGKYILEKIKEIAKQENCKRIEFCCWSFNKNAMDIYKHMGYKEQRVILEMDI